MRLLVLVAVAAVAIADASELTGYHYSTPASSYGVPQNSVTENFLNAVPTSPPLGLNLPIIEHQQFNPGVVVSSTPAPIVSSGVVSTTPAPSIISSTPAPSVEVGANSIGFNAQIPSLGSGFSFTTPAPNFGLNSGSIGVHGIGGLPSFGSTPAPNVVVTSGSQELLNPPIPSLAFNQGLNVFSTPAPIISSTPAPSINLNSGFNIPQFNAGYNFGLNGFTTPVPINLGAGGSLIDAFGVSTPGPIISGDVATSYQTVYQPAQVSKQVYFYAAPEEPELPRPRINIIPVAPPKKNIKVLFIKAPSPSSSGTIRIAAPPQNEEKTVVYVLVKKPEEQQDIEIQQPPATEPSKPEVYFIKYKSQQEAEQAISQIQEGHASSGPQIIANTVSGGDIVNSINREGSVTTLPIINYVTTPAPPINFIGGPIGGIVGPSFKIKPYLDVRNNLIPSGLDTSSIFSTAAPVTVSAGDIGLIGTSTVAPIAPHVTYGPPVLKK